MSMPPLDLSDWETFPFLQSVLDSIADPIFVKDRQHRWVACNEALLRLFNRSREEILGHSDPDYFPPEQAEVFWRLDDEVFDSGQIIDNLEDLTSADGGLQRIWTRKFPMRNAAGEIVGLSGIILGLGSGRLQDRFLKFEHIERENSEHQRLLVAQSELIDTLAMPVVEVWEGILLVPLVGAISERRAERVMESLLDAITRTSAASVIIDVTGLPSVDAVAAGYLIKAVKAAGLLGCRSVLCGIAPELARAFLTFDFDLGRVVTFGRLQDALRHAITSGSRAPRGVLR